MTNIYTLTSLPEDVQDILKVQHVVKQNSKWRKNYKDFSLYTLLKESNSRTKSVGEQKTLVFDIKMKVEPSVPEFKKLTKAYLAKPEPKVKWATDDYDGHKSTDGINEFSAIKARFEKTKEDQKKRSKSRAEVFTPAWVVNMQNNLIDEAVFGHQGSFNNESDDKKSWIPTEKVNFTEEYPWWKYVADRRLEMCCGEGPYLFTRYDAATGTEMPLKDEEGRFQRVGILDRKLRVAVEVCATKEEWDQVSDAAMKTTYGFEWQGDNLMLARLNFINTYFDYETEFYVSKLDEKSPDINSDERIQRLAEVAEIASWQLWQMDGLKMVTPDSCSSSCYSCNKKLRSGHDGILPVIKWGDGYKVFDEFLSSK